MLNDDVVVLDGRRISISVLVVSILPIDNYLLQSFLHFSRGREYLIDTTCSCGWSSLERAKNAVHVMARLDDTVAVQRQQGLYQVLVDFCGSDYLCLI